MVDRYIYNIAFSGKKTDKVSNDQKLETGSPDEFRSRAVNIKFGFHHMIFIACSALMSRIGYFPEARI